MRNLRFLIAIGAIAALAGGGVWLVARKKRALAQAPKYGMAATPVRVAPARTGEWTQTLEYLAVVEPIHVADVSARLTATVDEVAHLENETVKAGDLLVKLDARQIEESLDSMKAQIEQARADLQSNEASVAALEKTSGYWTREAERQRALAGQGTVSPSDAEAVEDKASDARGKLVSGRANTAAIKARIDSLNAGLRELETQRTYSAILSPFNGLVAHRNVDPGDLATPGKSLMVVEDRSRMKLSFDAPQQDLSALREGLEVRFTQGGRPRRATLSHLYPSLNAARMLRAEVYLEGAAEAGLSSGAYLPIRVVLSSAKGAVLIPASSLVESPEGKMNVFSVENGLLKAREVAVLGSSGDEVAVSGIVAGQEVVLSTFLGWAELSSGLKVEVLK